MNQTTDRGEMRRQERERQRVRDLEGKVKVRDASAAGVGHVRDLEDQMSAREIQQRDALRTMRGAGAAHRDGRRTPDVPDHLNNPDATVEDHIKDLERRANTAENAEDDLVRAGRGVHDAMAHSDTKMRPADFGEAADASGTLHGPTSPTMPTDTANERLDPQPAVEPTKAPKPKSPEAAYMPAETKDKPAKKD